MRKIIKNLKTKPIRCKFILFQTFNAEGKSLNEAIQLKPRQDKKWILTTVLNFTLTKAGKVIF